MMRNLARSVMFAGAVAASAMGGAAHAEDLTTTIKLNNVTGNTHLDWEGNTILEFFVGANAHINTMKWDLDLTALPGSWVIDAFMAFGDSTNWNRMYFLPSELAQPGEGYYSGTTHFAGFVDFRHLDTPTEQGDYSFSLNPDGMLRLEFAQNMNLLEGPDSIWKNATFTFGYSVSAVPEPSSYAMMLLGLGAVAGAARRRKQRAV